MKKRNKLLYGLSLTTLAMLTGTAQAGPIYTATELGTLGFYNYATGINSSGQVVGYSYSTATGYVNAYITGANGVGMTDLGTPISGNSYATAINSSGQVVGYADNPSGGTYTFVGFITGANGVGMAKLGSLGGVDTQAFGINNNGQVVGYSRISSGYNTAFITGANGVGMTSLGTLPSGATSYAYSINNTGQVAGFSYNNVFITGANGVGMTPVGVPTSYGGYSNNSLIGINSAGQVVYSNGQAYITGANGVGMANLGSLGGVDTQAFDINSTGQVGGYSTTASGRQDAYITGANGVGMIDLNSELTSALPSGVYLTNATAINDNGQIVAQASNNLSYLLTSSLISTASAAVPEPGPLSLMGAGLLAIGFTARSRKGKPFAYAI